MNRLEKVNKKHAELVSRLEENIRNTSVLSVGSLARVSAETETMIPEVEKAKEILGFTELKPVIETIPLHVALPDQTFNALMGVDGKMEGKDAYQGIAMLGNPLATTVLDEMMRGYHDNIEPSMVIINATQEGIELNYSSLLDLVDIRKVKEGDGTQAILYLAKDGIVEGTVLNLEDGKVWGKPGIMAQGCTDDNDVYAVIANNTRGLDAAEIYLATHESSMVTIDDIRKTAAGRISQEYREEQGLDDSLADLEDTEEFQEMMGVLEAIRNAVRTAIPGISEEQYRKDCLSCPVVDECHDYSVAKKKYD